jgi:hypothetical protein
MSKDWQRGSGYVNEPKVKKELGINSDGYKSGGVVIEATNDQESQTVDVRGTKRIRAEKKPVKATWY